MCTIIHRLSEVLRVIAYTKEFIFPGDMLDTDGYKNAANGQLIEALIGQSGASEIVIRTYNEISGM
jgi:hypothetical protein